MSNISKNTQQKYLLNGQLRNAPVQWEDVTIVAEFENDDVQPSLSIKDFKFNLEARKDILQWIEDGTNNGVGIFEGMPFELQLFNNQPQQENFIAFLDFTNGLKDFLDDGELTVSLLKKDGLDNFFEQIGGTTYGYLEEIGVISSGDFTTVPYVVEKKFNFIETLMSSIVIYLMVKELAVSVRNTSDAISLVVALASDPFGGQVSSVVRAIAIAIINLAYTLTLLLAITSLAKTYFETFIPPKRNHKAILLKTALEKVCGYFGYNLVCPIPEYNYVTYLPSNPNQDESTLLGFIQKTKGTQSGIPNVLDYGYNCEEMFNLAKSLVYAKMSIVGNDVHLRAKNDPYWLQQANWNMPDVLFLNKEWNTEEMKSTRLLSFEVDENDDWTIDNYAGTSVEIKSIPVTVIRKNAVLLKGLDEVNFGVALGNRKDKLNPFENLLKSVGTLVDTVTGIFGGGTSFAQKVQSKVGVLKQSNNWHSIPKLLYLSGGTMPSNHRTLWNARILWDEYHIEKSFVANNWKGQKIYYKGIEIPFGFEDYKKLTTNSYFYYNNKPAKIMRFEWTVGEDTAKIDFWIRQPYTFNLKETIFEP